MTDVLPSLGEVAYRAYARATQFKTYDGRRMPAWADLGNTIQEAWEAAGNAAAEIGSNRG